jgi:hypothetical protein
MAVTNMFEVIELVVANTTVNIGLSTNKKTVALCATAQLATDTLIALATEAYIAAANDPAAPVRAYSVRPLTIDLKGYTPT